MGASLPAIAGEVKVDINRDTKNSAAETETGYVKWSQNSTGGAASGTAAATKSFISSTGENITVTFAQSALSQSRGGTGLLSNWYQIGAQGTAKLVSDGLTVAPANFSAGGEIVMTLTGLSAGPHTLLTYHNAWDALAAGSLGPMNVSVNGQLAVADLQPTIRAATNALAPVAYLELYVSGPDAVTTILFSASTAGTQSIRNVMINGFEIDTPNSIRIANSPIPADGDEHVNADAGTAALSWSAATAGGVASHDVYVGTSRESVRNATRESAEYQGNQSAAGFSAAVPDRMASYFWRIDEVGNTGAVSKGTVWYFRPRHPAFPGAEGYGRFARGGRGGVVVEVTNLEDSGPGSLRDALTGNYGPRTVVFAVSGLITLRSHLTISQPYITIAGHTAPGKGICTRGYTLGMSGGRDVQIRYIRSRPGDIAGITLNGSGMAGSDHCIMDHCSISWGIDEGISTRSSKNITLQWTMLTEALNIAGHQNYPAGTAHGYAASIGGDTGSFHHNLLAHNEGRNWSMAGGLDAGGYFAGRLDIYNNVVYNWRSRTTDGGAHEVNFVNNYYKPGAATTHFKALSAQYGNFPGTQQYYVSGNIMPGYFSEANQSSGYTAGTENGGSLPTTYSPWVSAPFFPSYGTIDSARFAYKRVLSTAGCNLPLPDAHDTRIVRETRDGTYTYTGRGPFGGYPGLPNSQDDTGGWENYAEQHRPANWDTDHDGLPDWWERILTLNPASAPGDFSEGNADPDGDGYTRLEEYLAWMAQPHAECLADRSVEIDLSALTRGFSAAPAHSVLSPAGGVVDILADGHTARFTPFRGFTGLGSFRYSVTDSTGDSMTGGVNLLIAAAYTTQPVLHMTTPATLEFSGATGGRYVLEHSTDLLTWTDWLSLPADGSVQQVPVPQSLRTAPARYFRAAE